MHSFLLSTCKPLSSTARWNHNFCASFADRFDSRPGGCLEKLRVGMYIRLNWSWGNQNPLIIEYPLNLAGTPDSISCSVSFHFTIH